ncbi:MAG: hypothetical protein B7Z54_09800, partial [Sphingobacteriales bacterium 12-47-4]
LQALLDHADVMNNNVFAYGEIASDGHSVTEIAFSTAVVAASNAYTWSHQPYSKQANWGSTYLRVFHCNLVLEELEKLSLTAAEKSDRENIKGQALFNRAEAFLALTQVFAQPYNSTTAASDMGIPLRLTSNVAEQSRRANVLATYDRIISDATESIPLLPGLPLVKTRGSKAAAFALLARTYLVMQDYEKALDYAGRCLAIQSALKNYAELSTGASTQIGATANFPTPLHNPEMIFYNRMYTSALSGFLTTNYFVEQSLYNQYATNDLRRGRFFRVTASGITFKGNYNNVSSQPFCGIATDEVYLIRAECYARKGQITEALADLNLLLSKRYDATFTPVTANTADEALVKILT